MKAKTWVASLFALSLAGGLLALLATPGGVSVAGIDFGGTDRGWLADRSTDFLEDLKFKDFKAASTFHLPETQKARDIPDLIRRVFVVRHELLDIQRYKVIDVDLDRSRSRARVRTEVTYRVLGDVTNAPDPNLTRKLEVLLYWFKQSNGTWAMELESSLR
jgi:hypothetical protein